nr:hypothetical protein CFP56_73132 [Quercus suber]
MRDEVNRVWRGRDHAMDFARSEHEAFDRLVCHSTHAIRTSYLTQNPVHFAATPCSSKHANIYKMQRKRYFRPKSASSPTVHGAAPRLRLARMRISTDDR